jgi:hypothetical protein
VSSPVDDEHYIQFQLDQLAARNQHHLFEDICYRIAKKRLSSNLQLASGPVSAGGDQGRDAETYYTQLAEDPQARSTFARQAATKPHVLVCSTQKDNLEAKARADVKAICERGDPVDAIAFFATQNIPVATKHRMQDEARQKHRVTLSVFDGQAISHMLAEEDLIWIAERFLALPSQPAPEPSRPALLAMLDRMLPDDHRRNAFTAAIVALVLVAALIVWRTSLGSPDRSKAALASRDDKGPALLVFADIGPSATGYYVLTTPVTSAADLVTLEGGAESDADVEALIARHGGVAVGQLDATIVLQSERASLQVVNIEPLILAPKKAPDAAFVAYPRQGVVPVLQVTVNLDSALPVLMSGSSPYFRDHQIELGRGERETFGVSFMASAGYYEFDLLITYITAGKQYRQIAYGPGGQVFRLASQASDYHTYRTVYAGVSGNQFEVANRSQLCALFRVARGCR